MILQQFPELSHGNKKEHKFYPFMSEKLEKFSDSVVDSYAKQFPQCSTVDRKLQTQKTVITYDASAAYSIPSFKSAENIKRFYKYLGISPRKLLFISMVCPNILRVPSCFYYSLGYMEHMSKQDNKSLDVNLTKLNLWLSSVLKYPYSKYWNSGGALRANCLWWGIYDKIFGKYINTFPESRFFMIDSYYAFNNQQKLADSLSIEFKVPSRNISCHHEMKSQHKEELTAKLKAQIKAFFAKREQKFKEILKHKHNVKTFPDQSFGKDW